MDKSLLDNINAKLKNMNTQINYHYYGDLVRALFVVAGLVIIVSYPFFSWFIKAPIPFSIVGFIALAIFAGLLNPKQKWIMVLNTAISVAAFGIFEYAAVFAYLNLSPAFEVHIIFFWINQILSLIFFLAAYLATQTLRGAFTGE